MIIRLETNQDYHAVYDVNDAAFETSAEAKLVNALRKQATPIISLVAEEEGTILGHIMFSPVTLTGDPDLKIMGLAPMSVHPEHQRKGIGSELVRIGLEHCKNIGFTAAVVLGHATYYPRFGFVPSSKYGIDSEYDVPEDVFMAMELQIDSLKEKTGTIQYHTSFSDL